MIPVRVIPYKSRARYITEKTIDALFIPQDCTGWKDEKIFQRTEKTQIPYQNARITEKNDKS